MAQQPVGSVPIMPWQTAVGVAPGAGPAGSNAKQFHYARKVSFTFRAVTTGGAGQAVIQVLGCNMPTPTSVNDFVPVGGQITLNPTGVGPAGTSADGIEVETPYLWMTAEIVSISGTGTAVEGYAAG